MAKNYEFNFETCVLTVSAAFMEKASTNIRSEEYSILKEYKKDFPEMKVKVAKSKERKGEKRLHYSQMEEFMKLNYTAKKDGVELTDAQIAENERIDALLANFKRVQQLSLVHKSPYNFVFSWFKATFPNYQSSNFYQAILAEEKSGAKKKEGVKGGEPASDEIIRKDKKEA